MRRLVVVPLVLLVTLFVGYASNDLPYRGDPESPANVHVSTVYLEGSMEDMETPNVVAAVLADYRGYDTFGEALVVFVAALSCILILVGSRGFGPGNAPRAAHLAGRAPTGPRKDGGARDGDERTGGAP